MNNTNHCCFHLTLWTARYALYSPIAVSQCGLSCKVSIYLYGRSPNYWYCLWIDFWLLVIYSCPQFAGCWTLHHCMTTWTAWTPSLEITEASFRSAHEHSLPFREGLQASKHLQNVIILLKMFFQHNTIVTLLKRCMNAVSLRTLFTPVSLLDWFTQIF